MRIRLLLLIILLTAPGEVFAVTRFIPEVKPFGTLKPLVDQQMYEVSFSCDRRSQPLSNIDTQIITGPFTKKHVTISHFVVLASELPGTTPGQTEEEVKFSDTNVVHAARIFSVKNSQDFRDYRRVCAKTLILSGKQSMHLFPVYSKSVTHSPTAFMNLVFRIPDLLPPLWALFFNTSMSPHVSDKLGNIKQVEDPLKKFLAALDTAENYAIPSPLREGTQYIDTPYSRVTVKVTKTNSVFNSNLRPQLRDFLSKGGTATPPTDQNLKQNCTIVAAKMSEQGFSQKEDIPYALVYYAALSGMDDKKIMECLGKDYAFYSLNLGSFLWDRISLPQRLSAEKVQKHFPAPDGTPPQPEWDAVAQKVDDLVLYLSRISRKPSPSQADKDALIALTAPSLEVIDKTESNFLDGVKPGPAMDVVDSLFQRKVRRFGCYKAVTNGKEIDRSIVTILVFRTRDGDDLNGPVTVDFTDVVAIRPLFDLNKKIYRIFAYDKDTWIKDVLPTDYKCNKVMVKKPPEAAPQQSAQN